MKAVAQSINIRKNIVFKLKPKKAALLVLIGATLTIISASIMMLMGGGSHAPHTFPNDYGFSDAIVWFELISSPEELFLVLGPHDSKAGTILRQNMDLINVYDYLFMSAYSLFHIPIFLFLYIMNSQKKSLPGKTIIYGTGIGVLVLGMWIGDIFENIQLLKLTQFQDIESVQQTVLINLQIWTRVKWVSLFVSLLIMGIAYLMYYGKSFWTLGSLVFFCGFVAGMVSLVIPANKALLEPAGALMAVCWIWVLVHSILVYFSKKEQA